MNLKELEVKYLDDEYINEVKKLYANYQFLTGMSTPGWYFFDDAWDYAYGPYSTSSIAKTESIRYVKDFIKNAS